MSAKAEALYAIAAYRRMMRGIPGSGDDDAVLAEAEATIKNRPDPDVAGGVPPERGGETPESRRRMVRAARARSSSRRKAKR